MFVHSAVWTSFWKSQEQSLDYFIGPESDLWTFGDPESDGDVVGYT